MDRLREKKLFLLDMDGTIYLDEELFDGTLDFLACVKANGGRYMFLTNNSSRGVDKYLEKMKRLGIPAVAEDFFTSTDASILKLRKLSYHKIYAFGTTSFREQLRAAGLPVTDRLEDDIDCLLVGFDTELTFQKLEDACILLERGVDFYATNPDWVCPIWYGYVPDCGSVCEMLFRATKRRPVVIGKPQPDMALLAMEKAGYSKAETAIVGDRIYTDIACGVNAGITSIFVLSGEGVPEDIETYHIQPEYILKNIRELYEKIK